MSTLLVDKDFYPSDNTRGSLIKALRAAINAAEAGEDEVTIVWQATEITWQFEDGEFFVIG